VPADVSDPPIRREVAIGSYSLALGDRAGTAIASADGADMPALAQTIVPATGRDEPRSLAKALARARRERDPPRTGVVVLEGVGRDASEVADKIERVVGLFTELAQGRLDPASISDEVKGLCDLVQRLDREGRWEEALRLVRALAMLLALLGRWIELLQSLRVAVGAAERLADDLGKAWGLHEQGTWHLAANKHAEANDLLGKARDLRKRIGDHRGLAVTERNLHALCLALRAELRYPPRNSVLERILRSPLLALALAISLLVVGAAAGSIITSNGPSPKPPPKAAFSFQPTAPLVGESVSFNAASSSDPDPNASINRYEWKFGDGRSATGSTAAHAYAEHGTYKAELIVADTSEASGRTVQRITVTSRPPRPTPPSAPSGVAATAGDERATVTWTAPTDGGSPITSYTITPYIGAEAQPTRRVDGSPPRTGTTITGLVNGTTYTFTVTANNALGAGPASQRSNAVTPTSPSPAPTVPSAPTRVTASAAKASTAVTVSWAAPADGGSTITSYTITPYVGAEAQPPTVVEGSPPATAATIEGLAERTTYTFTVTATNAIGGGPASEHSDAATVP
jgi:PKD repeat protein